MNNRKHLVDSDELLGIVDTRRAGNDVATLILIESRLEASSYGPTNLGISLLVVEK